MDIASFKASLASEAPHAGLPPALAALWWAAKGDWDRAHALAQAVDDAPGAWVHAYLHRVEGDLSNAGYWYRRAQQPPETGTLEAEWTDIVVALLKGVGATVT